MQRIIFLFLLYPFSFFLSAEAADCYRLYLADKEGSDYCALSQRAMERRERQAIQLDERDRSVSSAYLSQLREQGWQIVTCSRWLNTVVVRRPDGKAIDETQFQNLPFVASYCPVTPSDDEQNPLNAAASRSKYEESEPTFIDEDIARPMAEVRGEALHAAGYRGRGMLIAVLDGGFSLMPQMPFFASKVVGWYDSYHPTDTEGLEIFSASAHGSQVTSIMAADIRDGIWGTAPEADYYLIRTEYDPTETPLEEDMWVAGAERADSIGADLINSSLGYHTFDKEEYNASWDDLCQGTRHISRAAEVACQKGILVCSAAGNDRLQPWKKIAFPSDVQEVFTIGATTPELTPASFTALGWLTPYVKPDVSCRGVQSWFLKANTAQPYMGNGTSYASPFMCGLMASLWSAVPEVLPARLCEVVRQSASMAEQPDELLGYGIPDMEVAMQLLGISTQALELLSDAPEPQPCYDLWGRRVDNCSQNVCFIVQNGKKCLILPR